jgi:predicted lipoprotein with Yx(FWY)xxD motif
MTRSQSHAAIAVAALALLVFAGCGSSSNSTTGGGSTSAESGGGAYGYGSESETTSKPTTSGAAEGAAVVSVSTVPKLDKVIVNKEGFTLYDFSKDKGTNSSCYGACAQNWPPELTEGEPQVGEGAMASKIGMTERKDGSLQVTYAGHPMYTFIQDQKPGEANGNDLNFFGGQWYALKPSGENAEG